MTKLHLNLEAEYFDQIKDGLKEHEYRLASKWMKRLAGKTFDGLVLKRGYPANGDTARIIERPWRGYQIQSIAHPHFGTTPVEVCAIIVNE